ncbi:MAG: protein-disulfide oxidoreductase DsbI [Duodenibacillus sp.]|nr:protein-disulfide oxidoreductase DsbI [Duodenibacillus sp.]
MKQFFAGLRRDPMNTLADWQDGRWPWGIIAFAMVALVLVAHSVFQGWLHMLPCEQCVYIRYGNLVMALGGVIAMCAPKNFWVKIVAYVVCWYGLIYTIKCSWKLIGIHDAVHSDDPSSAFGIQGCSTEPNFPFGLPLAEWAPDWFKPTGDCGYDAPVPAEGVELSGLQQFFIELYQESDGWYLIPQWKFMDMAKCCMLACMVALAFLLAMGAGFIWRSVLKKPATVK